MVFFKEIVYEEIDKRKNDAILAADIGGTTTDLGVLIENKGKLKLLISLHLQSKEIKNFTKVVIEILEHLKDKHNMKISKSCFAGAGVVSQDKIKLTNLSWDVNLKEIEKKTKLKSIILINDFQAIAYGIEALPKKGILMVKSGKAVKGAAKVLIGAGTGLGKAILLFDEDKKQYVPFPSEGGHGDLPMLNKEELRLREFIQKNTGNDIVEWEDVLSGRGLSNIYNFLEKSRKYKKTSCSHEIKRSKYDPMIITKHKNKDKQCRDTFSIFLKFYGRCAKNFALDVLAEGGIYIGGGIAAKNSSIFKKESFKKELTKTKKLGKVLKKIPVYVIKDYNVSLYGAAAAALRGKGGK